LLALMSTATDARTLAEGRGQWLGSPAFTLPRPVQDLQFENAELFSPPPEMVRKRYFVDAVRIVLPSTIWMAAMLILAVITTLTFEYLPVWSWFIVLPVASVLSSTGEVAAMALIKFTVSGRFQASVHPLWSDAVILDEIVNGMYESLSTSTLAPLQGTPFLAPALRLLGCRIGKWCFLDTTFFSEFDLVQIGNFAAINQGATIQTHLFEDRVMKSGEVRLGDGCAIGNMSIVLYDTDIEAGVVTLPMSVVMKGERLTADTRWIGIPCQQASSVPTIAGMLSPPVGSSHHPTQSQSWQHAAQ
jgi:non-ribosomal peptide synthetase-like protein